MKDTLKLLLSVFLCQLAGLLGTPFTISAIPAWYSTLNKPVFAPPNWLFGPVWTMLYLLMGISLFLIWKEGLDKPEVKKAVLIFLGQLFLNLLWSPLFFGLRSPLLGLIDIAALWFLIIWTMKTFYPLSKPAFYLLIPYFLWVSFASILNASILILN